MNLWYDPTKKKLKALCELLWGKESMFRALVLLLIATPVICVLVTSMVFMGASWLVLALLGRL